MWLLVHLLNRFTRNGVLRLIATDGSLHIFGGHGVAPRLHIKLLLNPELHAGEAYMNGPLTFEYLNIRRLIHLNRRSTASCSMRRPSCACSRRLLSNQLRRSLQRLER
jgi:hypothetical protein